MLIWIHCCLVVQVSCTLRYMHVVCLVQSIDKSGLNRLLHCAQYICGPLSYICQWTPRQVHHDLILLCLSKLVNAPVVYVCWSVESWSTKYSIPWNVPQSTGRYLPQQLTTCEGHYVIGLIAMRNKVQSITVCWSGLLPLVWFNSMNHLIAYTCSMELWSTCCHDGYALRLWACYNGHKLTPPFYINQIITL